MHYPNMVPGVFLSRPNRFIAHIEIDGQVETVHVKNTGRCRELLPVGAEVWCQKSDNPNRKTKYDLITVRKGDRLINMDSQAPNATAKEWLLSGGLGRLSELKAEYTHGDSRFDFSFIKDGRLCFLEVKGVTLEEDGVVRFPDAPTERGVKHLKELQAAAAAGFGAHAVFVIQMEDVERFEPNDRTHAAVGQALREAAQNGVQVHAFWCRVTADSLSIGGQVPVVL